MVTTTLSPGSELLRLEPDGHLKARAYRVKVVVGPDQGRELSLSGALTVGSAENAALRLTDTTISRLHLELTPRADGVALRDLDSKNGTFVAGVRVKEVLLEGTRELELGKTVLRCEVIDRDIGAPPEAARFGTLLGRSAVMRKLFGVLTTVASTSSSVLLLGETGTGKERVAQTLHQNSHRARAPFVILDCGAVSPNLLDSELFGHTKGAYTGASAERKGAFLSANGGTLFLDEIGELPLDLQPKLLRALESGTVKRLGEDQPRRADVRIIAATHRDLAKEVRAGRFRQDLYYRLAVIPLTIPALRDRAEDIPLLAAHFVAELGRDFEFSPGLLARLAGYAWPGNVRELRNLVERVVAGAPADQLLPEQAQPREESTSLSFKRSKERVVDAFTREYLEALLRRNGGNVAAVARESGLHRNHVAKLMVRLKLK